MSATEALAIVKLGGSVITHKGGEPQLNGAVAKRLVEELLSYRGRIGLVLGADLPLVSIKGEPMDFPEALYGALAMSNLRSVPTIEWRLGWGVEL